MKNTKKETKPCLKFSKKIVITCIIFIICYTVVQVALSFISGVELSPTLTTCVYAFFGTELASCAAIKIFDKETKDPKDKETKEESDDTSEG